MEHINRVGLDGYLTRLHIEMLSGHVLPLKTRVTCMISSAEGSPIMSARSDVTNLMEEFFKVQAVSIPSMFALLQQIRNQHRSPDNYLKVAFHCPVQSGGRKPHTYASALECHLMKNRMRSYVSTSLEFLKRIIIRITVDVSPETIVHIEELVSLTNELYDKKRHKRVDRMVVDVSNRLEEYERVQDYLVLGNQGQKDFGFVAQKWKGVPGGLKPMPGLERSVPDI